MARSIHHEASTGDRPCYGLEVAQDPETQKAPSPVGSAENTPERSADEGFADAMAAALEQAQLAADQSEVPVGAVIVRHGTIIAARHNERERTNDPTAHAEVLALRDAADVTGNWRLDDCTLVVTLEPCPMCAGAAVAARVRRVVYGAADLAGGAALSLYNLCDDPRLNHQCDVVGGVAEAESATLLEEFFAARR